MGFRNIYGAVHPHSYKPQLHTSLSSSRTFSMNSNKPEKQTWHLDGDLDLLEANFVSQEVFLKREPAVRIQQLQLVCAALTYRHGCWSRRGCSKHCMLGIGLCKQWKGSVQEGNPRLPGLSVLTNSDKTCQADGGKHQLNLLKGRRRSSGWITDRTNVFLYANRLILIWPWLHHSSVFSLRHIQSINMWFDLLGPHILSQIQSTKTRHLY